ncbi:hypothetical protein RZE82_02775 [Mollicutes bacterium LVI A0039]|nr:hypothetical protein RZE82_02775 [Mollicutes bacterium LVI A0039]
MHSIKNISDSKLTMILMMMAIVTVLNIFVIPMIYWPLIGNQLVDEVSIPLLMKIMISWEACGLIISVVAAFILANKSQAMLQA